MIKMRFGSFARVFLVALVLEAQCGSGVALAQGFPNRPVTLVVPAAAGGGGDAVARPLGEKLGQILGQAIVVENRAGANSNIAAVYVAKAAADGYTLLQGTSSLPINVSLYGKLPYDPVKDFVTVALVAISPSVLLVHPSLPVKSVAELIAMAKAQPGKLNYTTAGAGSTMHLAAELFSSMAGISMTHVPYKGAGPAIADVVAGHANLLFVNIPPVLGQIRAGALRPLAVTTPERSSVLSDLPTMAESGLKGFDSTTWFGVMAPAATPREVVMRLNRAIQEAVGSKDLQERLKSVGLEPRTGTPEEFAQFLKRDIDGWAKVVKASGAKAE